MRIIVISVLFLGIFVLAIVGCLFIFGIQNAEQALGLLMKAEGTLLFLGICAAAISLLLGAKKDSSD